MSDEKKTDPFAPRFRSVEPAFLAESLAILLDLTAARARLALRVAWYPRAPLSTVPFVDADAWLAWCLAGLRVFTIAAPSYREVADAAGRTLLVLNLARARDNLSEVAHLHGSSRKVVRDRLRRFDLYPLSNTAAALLGEQEPSADGSNAIRAYSGAAAAALSFVIRHTNIGDRELLGRAIEAVARLGREAEKL